MRKSTLLVMKDRCCMGRAIGDFMTMPAKLTLTFLLTCCQGLFLHAQIGVLSTLWIDFSWTNNGPFTTITPEGILGADCINRVTGKVREFKFRGVLDSFFDSGAYGLFFMILLWSGFWPHLKVMTQMLMTWFPIPLTAEENILHMIEILGSLCHFDVYVMIGVGTLFTWYMKLSMPMEIMVDLKTVINPGPAVLSYVAGTVTSFMCANYCTYIYRKHLKKPINLQKDKSNVGRYLTWWGDAYFNIGFGVIVFVVTVAAVPVKFLKRNLAGRVKLYLQSKDKEYSMIDLLTYETPKTMAGYEDEGAHMTVKVLGITLGAVLPGVAALLCTLGATQVFLKKGIMLAEAGIYLAGWACLDVFFLAMCFIKIELEKVIPHMVDELKINCITDNPLVGIGLEAQDPTAANEKHMVDTQIEFKPAGFILLALAAISLPVLWFSVLRQVNMYKASELSIYGRGAMTRKESMALDAMQKGDRAVQFGVQLIAPERKYEDDDKDEKEETIETDANS